MPQLPQNVTIVTKNSRLQRLEIDGAEFPWLLLADDGAELDIPGEGLARLNLTLLVDADRINLKEETND